MTTSGRRRYIGFGLAPLLVLGGLTASAGAEAPTDGRSVGGPVSEFTRPTAATTVRVMLELDAEPAVRAYSEAPTTREARTATRAAIAQVQATAAGVRAALRSETVIFEATKSYAGIAVQTTSDRLDDLARIPGVRAVHRLVPKQRSHSTAIPLIDAPAAWTGAAGTGEGVTIGIMDTGIDYTHAMFGGPGTPEAYAAARAAKEAGASPEYPDPVKVAGGYDLAGDAYDASNPDTAVPQPDDNPLDCEGHGTHVAGTAAGYGVAADGSTYRGPWDASTPFDTMAISPGVAPKATLYAIKVFGCEGSTDLVVPALDWALDPNGDGDFSDHLDIVNMSLGADYGSVQDPDSVATDNVSAAGVLAVAAAGNSGDLYEITGSPAVARRALSVAASEDSGQVTDGFRATIGETAAIYPALVSEAYDWTSGPGATGTVVEIGDWSAPPDASNNTDGCNEFSTSDAALVAGKIVLLQWDGSDMTRRCGSAIRTANAALAGATGAILGGPEAFFTLGITGDSRIPAVITLGSTTTALHSALKFGTAVTATLDGSLRGSQRVVATGANDPTDTAAFFTSRGTSLAGNVKPDVSAPGGTIYSAAVGSGNGGTSASGTSMATPATAGAAALVLAAHPKWNPEQVKAALMNTAVHDLFRDPGRSGPRHDVLRTGAGRIDVKRAVKTGVLAYVIDDPGAVSVSFGVMNVTEPTATSKEVRVQDVRTRGRARTYEVSLRALRRVPGVRYTVAPSSVRLRPGQSVQLTIGLSVDPSRLTHSADPTISLDPYGDGTMRDYLTDASSLLTVAPPRGTKLRVPVFSAPRPSSELSAPRRVRVTGSGDLLTGSFELEGQGVDNKGGSAHEDQRSRITALQLMGTSARLPRCATDTVEGCVATLDDSASDLRYVGFTSDARLVDARGDDPLSPETPGRAYIGVASWQPWRSPASVANFLVYIDTDGDGAPDLVLTNVVGADDVFFAAAFSLRPDDGEALISLEMINNVAGDVDTAKFHSNVMTMPINLAWLANPTDDEGNPLPPFILPGQTQISYWVESYGLDFTLLDMVGAPDAPLTSDLLAPALTAFTSKGTVPAVADPGTRLTVTMNPVKAGDEPQLLLLHHLNTLAHKAQVVKIVR